MDSCEQANKIVEWGACTCYSKTYIKVYRGATINEGPPVVVTWAGTCFWALGVKIHCAQTINICEACRAHGRGEKLQAHVGEVVLQQDILGKKTQVVSWQDFPLWGWAHGRCFVKTS